jgi:glycosyltransferase involved in cell wall biosynthesis
LDNAPDAYNKRPIWYKLQAKRIFTQAEAVSNVSASIGKIITQLFKIPLVHTIHNVVDEKLFYYKEVTHDVFTFIHVSVLNEQKNIISILHAFAQLSQIRKDWKLILVGPYDQQFVAFIQQLGLMESVELKGMVPYPQVATAMQQADAFVLFSKHENFPCVVVEALCCGLPVIAGDIAGVGEAVNQTNGILIKGTSEDQLKEALVNMLNNHKRYKRNQIAADAASRYSYPVIGRQIFNLYSSFLGMGS